MASPPQISQRDLRLRSKEIMDAVERGQAFTVTRDGRSVAELQPLRPRRAFIPRAEFMAAAASTPTIDPARFRQDVDAAVDQDVEDPFAR